MIEKLKKYFPHVLGFFIGFVGVRLMGTATFFGALIIASLPTYLISYYVCKTKFNNEKVALWGGLGCVLAGLIGGLVLAIPMMILVLVVGKKTSPQVSTENSMLKK